jgi:hypothetical protein
MESKMKLKIFAISLALLASANIASADEYVNGYTRRDGTYVQPYEKTSPNNSMYDNYSTKGNTNPYNGEKGYVNPDNNSSGSYGNNSYGNYSGHHRR